MNAEDTPSFWDNAIAAVPESVRDEFPPRPPRSRREIMLGKIQAAVTCALGDLKPTVVVPFVIRDYAEGGLVLPTRPSPTRAVLG